MVRLNHHFVELRPASTSRRARQQHIAIERLQWRARTSRRLVQLSLSQSVLVVGRGADEFARELRRVSRNQTTLTVCTWDDDGSRIEALAGRKFDCIVGTNVLDSQNCEQLLTGVSALLEQGGNMVFFEDRDAPCPRDPATSGDASRSAACDAEGRQRLLRLAVRVGLQLDVLPYHECKGPVSSRLAAVFPSFPLLADSSPAADWTAGCFIIHARPHPHHRQQPAIPTCEHEKLLRSTSCVVPCHNEEMNIELLVDDLLQHYGDYIHEIILVDDNSYDGTRAVMLHLAEREPRVRPVFLSGPNGVGRALAAGYRKVTGRYVLSLEPDCRPVLPDIRDLFDMVADGADVAIGSRFSRESLMLRYPFAKLLANRAFHMIARLVLMRRFHDLTNTLKLMRREVVESLDLTERSFAVNAQTGLLPLLSGYCVREVPVSWINRDRRLRRSTFRLLLAGPAYGRVLLRLCGRSVWNSLSRRRGEATPENAKPLTHPAHGELKVDARV